MLYLGVAAAGGVGYYLYTAGGNPKVAEKQFEGTLHLKAIHYCVASSHYCSALC